MRATRNQSPLVQTPTTNSKQNNVLFEISKKNPSNISPDVVSDLEEILGSPIKTLRQSESNSTHRNSGMVRIDYNTATENVDDDEDIKPTTRSSKRLSYRNKQPSVEMPSRTSNRTRKTSGRIDVKSIQILEQENSSVGNHGHGLTLDVANNAPIIMNIKQEKEVSFTMTDENSLFTCEMCSAVFSDRAQLLVHVPVHI